MLVKIRTFVISLLLAIVSVIGLAVPANAAEVTTNGIRIWTSWTGTMSSRSTSYSHYVDGWCGNGNYVRGPVRGAYSTSSVTCWPWQGGIQLVRGRRASDGRVMATLFVR